MINLLQYNPYFQAIVWIIRGPQKKIKMKRWIVVMANLGYNSKESSFIIPEQLIMDSISEIRFCNIMQIPVILFSTVLWMGRHAART